MDGLQSTIAQTIIPIATTAMIAAALVILWRRTRSVWLLVALGAELGGVVMRLVMATAYETVRSLPFFFPVWALCSVIFAASLLGYAIESTQKARP
jgi:hypothetical protein